jgi:hypothetical protein
MEALRSSETSVHVRSTQRYVPEDDNFLSNLEVLAAMAYKI